MFFEYHQNCVKNEFQVDENLCSHLLIEADNAIEANKIAQQLGICFEEDYGYETSICRWYRAYACIDFPSRWDNNLLFETAEEYCQYLYERYREITKHRTSPHSRIHYKNRKRSEIGKI